MADFKIAYALVKEFEGAYSDDPNDKGGETYSGISRVYFPKWPGWAIVDEYKASLSKSPGALSRALAAVPRLQTLVSEWYRDEWWNRLGLGSLEQPLANEIFEQAVNLGKAGCGKKVQTTCNAWNYGSGGKPLFTDLVIDGAIGPKTLTALSILVAQKTTVRNLVHSLNCMQGCHYLELAAKKPTQRKFTAGWMKRTHCEE